MNNPTINTIADYIKAQSRNRIIFHSQNIAGLTAINVGLKTSETIFNIKETSKISLIFKVELERVLNTAICHHDLFGRYLSIENLGILFEPELKIDFAGLINSFSQNNVLFVKWEGEVDAENIYFLTKENGIKINIKNLSHIEI